MYTDLLSAVIAAREHSEQSRTALRKAVAEAYIAGVPAIHVANAAGITRETVYQWNRQAKAGTEQEVTP